MMKRLIPLLLLSLLLLPQSIKAEEQLITYDPATGLEFVTGAYVDDEDDLGLGVPPPTGNKLYVLGNSGISGNLTVGGSTNVTLDLTVGSTSMYVNSALDRVGIGTAAPVSALQVVGDEVRIGDAGTVVYAEDDGDLFVEDDLEVADNIYVKDNIICDDSYIQQDTSDGSDTKSLRVGGGGSLIATRGAYIALYGNEATGIGGNMIVSAGNIATADKGQIEFETGGTNDRLIIDNAGDFNFGSGDLTIGGSVNIASDLTVDGSTLDMAGGNIALNGGFLSGDAGSEGIFVDGSGNVGIGNTNPGAELEIGQAAGSWGAHIRFTRPEQSATIDSRIAVASDGTIFRNFDNASSTMYSFRDFNDVHIWDLTAGGRSLFNGATDNGTTSVQIGGASSLDIEGTATFVGNVGIGTTAPDVKLDVIGDATISSDLTLSGTAFIEEDLIFNTSGGGLPYGGICTNTAIAVTLTDQNTWYEIDAAQAWSACPLNLVTFTDPYITVTHAGTYLITWAISAACDAADQHIEVGIMIDQTTVQNDGQSHNQVKFADREINYSSPALVALTAGQKVSLAARNTTSAGDILTTHTGNLKAIQIGGN